MLLLFIGAALFVVLGMLLLLNPDDFTTAASRNPAMIRIAGIVATVFFGLCLAFITRKLFDKKVGLTIDQDGITDNSNATSVGLIEWADITGIDRVEIASTKILMLQTNKPDKYIERAKNAISRRAMKANYKNYGSPLAIIANSLKLNFDELEKLLATEIEKRKRN